VGLDSQIKYAVVVPKTTVHVPLTLRNTMDEGIAKLGQRIQKALDMAVQYGGIDGDHHKAWVIDQMVRALTGCPMVEKTALDCNRNEYSYKTQGESEEYKELVRDAKAGEDGPETYSWEVGIAP